MNLWPLSFHPRADGQILFTDDAGGFFLANEAFLQRYAEGRLDDRDLDFLRQGCHGYERTRDTSWTSFAYRWATRQARQERLNYVILVPTLRCNLACDYCQVSRASEKASGYDWSADTVGSVLRFLDRMEGDQIKVEFQGGEPLLRTDLLAEVRSFCRTRFKEAQFVVCTNLQRLGAQEWEFLDAEDTFISTSLDGNGAAHERQRTKTRAATEIFFRNLEEAIERFGPDRVSALPTIDVHDPPDLSELLDCYDSFGFRSIYLRPTNYQGFARTNRQNADTLESWNALYGRFIELLLARNLATGSIMEEYYFTHCLKRVLRGGLHSHVDLRNPNLMAADYLVVDYDGRLYPTDEARMLARIGLVDLSVGDVYAGLNQEVVDLLNSESTNNFDPDCIHCAFQPYCGVDRVDDLSRYGRIDLPRHETWFCGRHKAVFDKVFELIFRRDDAARHSVAHWLGVESWDDDMAPILR